jgi:hypothetical protein
MTQKHIYKSVTGLMRTPLIFAEKVAGVPLRSYQEPVALAIVNSVIAGLGHSIVVIFPRQSGKNELQALVEAYLLSLLHEQPAEIVKVCPTARPQSQTAMRRLERVLKRNLIAKGRWHKESGYIFTVGRARIYFLSGASDSNIVGATASTLLEIDEAQDIEIDKYDRDIAPMAASTNATRVFWGTAWTSRTLLARELRLARQAEQADGIIRSFVLSAAEVSAVVPAYGQFVDRQVAILGRNNPMVKTQFFSEEIDAEGGMFNRQRQALMQGTHPRQDSPCVRADLGIRPLYAITIDVAGEDEAARDPSLQGGAGGRSVDVLQNPGRDSTALTVFEIDTTTLEDPLIARPTYKVINRAQWTGIKHTSLFARLTAIIDLWQPAWIVIDSTGVGQTISSFLFEKYPNVIPFVFTSASKSQLGWNFIALVETGRYKEYDPQPHVGATHPAQTQPGLPLDQPPSGPYLPPSGSPRLHSSDPLQSTFWTQIENCQYSILEGPGRLMRWGVPDGSRDTATGELLHDDLLLSAALVSELDGQSFGLAISQVIRAPNLFQSKDF